MTEPLNVVSHPVPTVDLHIRKAIKGDCDVLVELINFAGEGLPLYLWTGLAGPDQDAWEVGRMRAARDKGGFSYRNSLIAELDGNVAGAMVAYPLPKEPQPIAFESTPRLFVPALELENIAAGTFYVNAIAVLPEARGLGIGTRLMLVAEQAAANSDCNGVSLIVSDANTGARRLYKRLGFREVAARPMIKDGWINDGDNWILMVKYRNTGQDAPDPDDDFRHQRSR